VAGLHETPSKKGVCVRVMEGKATNARLTLPSRGFSGYVCDNPLPLAPDGPARPKCRVECHTETPLKWPYIILLSQPGRKRKTTIPQA
jgi:hypothetical protein